MLSDETAGLSEIAAALHQSEGWVRRNWLSLHQKEGFPRKIPGGWVWPRRLVEAWLRSGGVLDDAGPLPANDNPRGQGALAAISRALEGRYAR